MYYVFCNVCKVALRLFPAEKLETELLLMEDRHACPECHMELSIGEKIEGSKYELIDVTVKEAFAYIHGLGLPKEKNCSAEAVTELLKKRRVVQVDARQVRGSHRCVIDYLELEDGTKVYLGASSHGAVVFRVVPKYKYAEKIDVD